MNYSDEDSNNLMWLRRLLAIGVSIALWWMSVKFSVRGFEWFQTTPNPEDAWIGYTLAFAFTAYELIWNSMKERTNLTMWAVGVIAYGYGIGTNIIGIAEWLGITGVSIWWVLPVVIGLVIEIAPEPSLVWGITGNYRGGDFLGNLFGNIVPVAPTHSEWGGNRSAVRPVNKSPVPPTNMNRPKPPFQTSPSASFKPNNQRPMGNRQMQELKRTVNFTEQPERQYRNLSDENYEEPNF